MIKSTLKNLRAASESDSIATLASIKLPALQAWDRAEGLEDIDSKLRTYQKQIQAVAQRLEITKEDPSHPQWADFVEETNALGEVEVEIAMEPIDVKSIGTGALAPMHVMMLKRCGILVKLAP